MKGVFQVYTSQSDLDQNKPLDYPYTKLSDFVQDMNILCAMIANGPLLVFSHI